jgi:hypothetical protein
MAKIQIKHNPKAIEVANGVINYLNFCRDYGYNYDPDHYGNRSQFPYQQYERMLAGKAFKDQWADDARRFGRYIGS